MNMSMWENNLFVVSVGMKTLFSQQFSNILSITPGSIINTPNIVEPIKTLLYTLTVVKIRFQFIHDSAVVFNNKNENLSLQANRLKW